MDQFALGANECLAITKANTKLKILGEPNEIEVAGGEIVKVLRLASLGSCFIRLYSSENRNLILSDNTYSCDHNAIKILSEKLGSMLIPIGDRTKRLMICNNSDYERFLLNLKLNDVVKVNKFLFKRNHHVVCTVKYIGAAPEIGPGTYVGCKLYDDTETIDEKHKLAKKYFTCNDTNGFIRNCGCFFTRTMLLDQNIDNLISIIMTKHKKANKLKPADNVHDSKNVEDETNISNMNRFPYKPKIENNIPSTSLSSNNQTPEQTAFRTTRVSLEQKPTPPIIHTTNYVPPHTTSSSLNNPNTTPPVVTSNHYTSTTNYTPTTYIPTPNFTSTTNYSPTVTTSSTINNQKPPSNVFKSTYVYPETRPVYVSENQFFNRDLSFRDRNTATDDRSYWARHEATLTQSTTRESVPPKKNRCIIM